MIASMIASRDVLTVCHRALRPRNFHEVSHHGSHFGLSWTTISKCQSMGCRIVARPGYLVILLEFVRRLVISIYIYYTNLVGGFNHLENNSQWEG